MEKDLKNDLITALELNESVFSIDNGKDFDQIHFNIICEIRARLLQGIPTLFFPLLI
jgi:hypothetical protein